MFTMDAVLDLCVNAHPNLLAVTLDDRRLSFGDVDAWVKRYTGALQHWGVRRGDIAVTFCGIALENVFLHFAMARIGAVFVPIDPGSSARELDDILDYLEPSFLIADETGAPIAEAAAARAGVSLAIVAGHDRTTAGINLGRLARDNAGAKPASRAEPGDVHAMYLTSGSTGRPKAVAISHRANWLRAHLAASVVSSGGMVCMFPLFHMAGWQVIAQSWARRRPVHLVRRADAETLLGTVEQHGASTLYAIPAVWKRILECRTTFDLSTLRAVDAGTSFVGPDLILALRDRFPGTHNMLGYGSTEMGLGLQIAHEDILARPGSVGLPGPGIAARIVDGELWLKGETMMEGYYRLPEETAGSLVDGWYRTGDLAEQDEDDFFTISGRRREIIRSGGESISPVELDIALKRVGDVEDIAAIGLPHADWGEIVCAAVVPQAGRPVPSLDQIRIALGDLNRAKLPRMVRAVGFIPRTAATGQVRRNQLREMVLAAVGDDIATG